MLGLGPCYHMVDVLADLDQANLWKQALAGEPRWNEIFDGYQSTVDWPGGYFYRELAEFYPDAKVLLSVRDAESWERSMRETVWAVRNGESLIRLLSSAQAHVNPQWQRLRRHDRRAAVAGQGTFAAVKSDPAQMIERWNRHNEEVQGRRSRQSGCSCGASPKAGSRCASSWRYPSRACPCRTSTTARSSSTASSTARSPRSRVARAGELRRAGVRRRRLSSTSSRCRGGAAAGALALAPRTPLAVG